MQYQGYRPARPSTRRPHRKKKPRTAIYLLAAVVLLLAVLWLMLKPARKSEEYQAYLRSRDVFLDNIYVDGIALSGLTYNEAWEAVAEKIASWEKSWSLALSCNGHVYTTLNYASTGLTIDGRQLDELLREAWQYGHTGGFEEYRADAAALAAAPYDAYLMQSQGESSQLDYILRVIRDNVYRAPQNAALLAFDAENLASPFVFQPSKEGITIDCEKAKKEILQRAATGDGGEYQIELLAVAPDISLEDVKKDVSLLAVSTTAIDKHSTKERNENIALAFSRINGLILEDGDRFSFNKLVGKRSLQNGFKTALGYVSGELTETVGGGVCQASTTIYSAALCAGMSIRSRTPHSIPVSYISLGQDATVNDMRGHEIDLAFSNKTGSRVYIVCGLTENSAGRLQCVTYFYGRALPDGVYCKLESVVTETLPIPDEIVRPDTEAKYVKYTNQRYKLSGGSEGYVVKTYLQRCSGESILDQQLVSTDTYKARAPIYYVGVTER